MVSQYCVSDAVGFRASHEEGRFVLHSHLGNEAWRVVVEPDVDEQRLIVVTAWRV